MYFHERWSKIGNLIFTECIDGEVGEKYQTTSSGLDCLPAKISEKRIGGNITRLEALSEVWEKKLGGILESHRFACTITLLEIAFWSIQPIDSWKVKALKSSNPAKLTAKPWIAWAKNQSEKANRTPMVQVPKLGKSTTLKIGMFKKRKLGFVSSKGVWSFDFMSSSKRGTSRVANVPRSQLVCLFGIGKLVPFATNNNLDREKLS